MKHSELLKIIVLIFFSTTCSAQYAYFYGNIHSHSSYSDGNKDSLNNGITLPKDNYSFAKVSSNFDFLGISEHNHAAAGMSIGNYHKGILQADSANDENDFVALYGMEWGKISSGGHVIIYGFDSLIGWESGNYDIYNSNTNYKGLFEKISKKQNAFAWLAHPDWNDYNNLAYTPYDSIADKAIVGMAIRSGPAFSTNVFYSNPSNWNFEKYYQLMLSNGYHLGPGIDHDNHYLTFGRTSKARTVVFCDSLKRNSIIEAYQKMHFYASDDWNCKVKFEIAYNPMGSTVTKAGNPTLYLNVNDVGENVDSVRIMYGIPGSQLAPQSFKFTNQNTVVYTHAIQNLDSYYYYAVITQKDGDKIWTAPLWYNRNDGVATSINVNENENEFFVYPNPSAGSVNVLFNNKNQYSIRVYTVSGREIYIKQNSNTNHQIIDLSSFGKGLYTIVIHGNNKYCKKNILIQ